MFRIGSVLTFAAAAVLLVAPPADARRRGDHDHHGCDRAWVCIIVGDHQRREETP